MTIHYRCSCGRVFEYEEAKRRHYIGGETEIFCPSCDGDDLEEVFKCCDCGEFFPEDKLNGMYSDQLRCDDCLRKKATLENALAIGKDNPIHINGFFEELFSVGEIERILLDYAKNESHLCSSTLANEAERYCLDDASWFADWLGKKEASA